MTAPFSFAHFDVDHFLRDHWQKKPMLIRNPWAAWNNPLEPDELAGMALEPDIESRLIVQGSPFPSRRWTVEHGPIPEERFAHLGGAPWTLLVQAVDHYVPAVAALLAPFRFIPDWRIDDVMVSYASDHGGVGAHYDQYDVFLIQGLGRRRWQIGQHCNAQSPLVPHDELRLLTEFDPTAEWVLDPGDMLYLPPGIAHKGVAIGDDCMTYSVGFRAPSRADLIGNFVDDMMDELDSEAGEDDRYTDPDLKAATHPGEISAETIDRLHQMVLEKLGDRDAFARWAGRYLTTPKYGLVEDEDEDAEAADDTPNITAIRTAINANQPLPKDPSSRVSFIRRNDGTVMLFVDGKLVE